jgi:DNA transformation protein
MTDAELLDAVAAALAELPFRSRRMFGGYGLYLNDAFFGVISDSHLYFRTDEASRAEYTTRGMPALQPMHRPRGPKTVDRNFEVPRAVVENPDLLRDWAIRATQSER